jgi:hypothetical protein
MLKKTPHTAPGLPFIVGGRVHDAPKKERFAQYPNTWTNFEQKVTVERWNRQRLPDPSRKAFVLKDEVVHLNLEVLEVNHHLVATYLPMVGLPGS